MIFVKVDAGKLRFDTIVKPTKRSPLVNLDKKKGNLTSVSLVEKYIACIQRQEWARKHEFVVSSKI